METSNNRVTRIPWIDAAKAVSIFMIVLGHCADKSGEDNILLHLCMFTGVGVFFLLSGMTFCFSSDHHSVTGQPLGFPWFDNRPFRAFLSGLVRHIVLPYFIWSMISILIYGAAGPAAAAMLHSDRHNFSIWKNILGMFYANSGTGYMEWNRPLWFLPCLAVVELIWFALLKLILLIRFDGHNKPVNTESAQTFQQLRKGEKGAVFLPAALYAACLILPLIWFYCLASRGIRLHLPWETETAISVMPYFGIGRLIRGIPAEAGERHETPGNPEAENVPEIQADRESIKNAEGQQLWQNRKTWGRSERGKREKLLMLLLAAGLLIVECSLLKNTKYADFRADRFSDLPLFLPDAAAGILFTLTLAVSLQNSRALQYIGRRTLAILVMHKFPIMACKILLRAAGWEAATLPGMILTDLFMAAAVIALCLPVERLLSRFAPALFGKSLRPGIRR